jgi:hypothetical protein
MWRRKRKRKESDSEGDDAIFSDVHYVGGSSWSGTATIGPVKSGGVSVGGGVTVGRIDDIDNSDFSVAGSDRQRNFADASTVVWAGHSPAEVALRRIPHLAEHLQNEARSIQQYLLSSVGEQHDSDEVAKILQHLSEISSHAQAIMRQHEEQSPKQS